ncbi:MAG: twin-arginine translocase subunit TatC [Planctomycetes bacterium]|nr:twin-arginine translocase subunit TatC [Planctomycetota bacterium]
MGKTKKKKKQGPLDSTMGLGDHLEELRARLILAIIGLLVGTILCLCLGTRIIRFIERPYTNAIAARTPDSRNDRSITDSNDLVQALCANIITALSSDPNAPSIDPNIVEFVQRIYAETVTQISNDPNAKSTSKEAGYTHPRQSLVTLAPADSFVGFMKISLISGLIVSSPWVFYHLWMFVAAGLYSNERRYVQVAVPFSVILFITGALFFLLVVAPISLRFFLTFGDLIGVSPSWTFQKYISFVTILMLVFGLGFQTPIAIFILNRTGLISIPALRSSRKYVFLGTFVVAALVTPPDAISQITLAIPLFALFEMGILLCWFAERRKKAKESRD